MSLVQNITSIIPQRPPFVMIDGLIYADEAIARTIFQVNKENVLVEDGIFSEAGVTENIAQTAAAHAGYIASQNKAEVKIGYIGAIKNLKIFLLPKFGDILMTEVKIINQIFNITIIEGRTFCNDQPVAQCEMKIFLQDGNHLI